MFVYLGFIYLEAAGGLVEVQEAPTNLAIRKAVIDSKFGFMVASDADAASLGIIDLDVISTRLPSTMMGYRPELPSPS